MNSNTNNSIKRKTFDPTVVFSFFGSWMDSIEAIEKACGVEIAYSMFKAVAYYSMYEEQPVFSELPFLYAVWEIIEREIDESVRRRKRNFEKDELNEKIQIVIDALAQNPNASTREIERITGVSKSTVHRILRKHKDRIEAAINGSETATLTDAGNATVPDVDNDTVTMVQDGTE